MSLEIASHSHSTPLICFICGQDMKQEHVNWVSRCSSCEVLRSTLWDDEIWDSKVSDLDEVSRFQAIGELRKNYAREILGRVQSIVTLKNKKLCDVGCGYGWFLQEAKNFGMETVGIEPEPSVASVGRGQNLNIITGLFPDCLSIDDLFDMISFNDVLEHIPSVRQATDAVKKHLKADGIVVLVLPSSDGILFRVAQILSRFGFN